MSRIFKKHFLSIIFSGLLFFSCKTTSTIEKAISEPAKPKTSFIVAHDIVFPELEGSYKYIFFRLYNPSYKNPFYIANLLKGGISSTTLEDTPDVSHAAINFSLDDNYFGLTLGGEYQLAQENCSTPQDNKYMKNCDPEKSEQITYALKVTEEEYQKTKEFVENYSRDKNLKYASTLNFKISLFSIKRKFFTPPEKQKFGTVIYPEAENKKYDPEDENSDTNFVCSTFIGYVLYNNIEDITKYFDDRNIKYEYLCVADISMIPGMTPLFYSNWDNYESAARAFVEEYPEFKQYLNN